MMTFRASLLVGSVLAIALNASAHANLVTNGNFATGDFTGWTQPVGAGVSIDTFFPPPGSIYSAMFSADGTLSQTITTVPGQAYTLSFAVLDQAGFFADSFSFSFGGFSQTITGDQAGSYYFPTYTVPGADITGTTTTLSFTGSLSGLAESAWNLGDVSLTAVTSTGVPEPTTALLLGTAMCMLGWAGASRRTSGAA